MKTKSNQKNKSKSLFDHVNHIKKVQDKSYYKNLSESDKKTFNCYMIFRVLSMDPDNIEVLSIISKYLEYLPENEFYLLTIHLIEKSNKFYKYIKPATESIDERIIECLCKKFEVGKKDAIDFYHVICSMKNKNIELTRLLNQYGYNG